VNADSKNPGKVLAVPRRPRSAVIFGEESLLAPKVRLEISIDASDEQTAQFAAIRAKVAESNARRVLSSIARESTKRTLRFPNSPVVWVQAGLAHLAEGDYPAAETEISTALSLDPTSRNAKLTLARLLNETNRGREAIEILSGLRGDLPDDLDVLVALAVVTADVDGVKPALSLFQSEPQPDGSAAAFFAARGSLRVATGDYSGAIADLRKVVRLKSDWVQARNVLGIAELKAGQRSAAERRFREAVRIAPMYLEAFLNLLRVMLSTGRNREALDLATAQYRDVPSAPGPVGRIASQAALELGEWMIARSWLHSALAKTEDPLARARLLNDVGVTYSRVGNHTEAEKKFKESVEVFPTELAIVNRGKAMLQAGSPLEAATWLASASVPDGEPSTNRRLSLAISLNEARRHEDAAAIYEGLIADEEAEPRVFSNLAGVYTDYLDDPHRAAGVAAKGLALSPSDPILVNNLAYALLMAGDVDEAEKVLESPVVPNSQELIALTATRGLLRLLQGDVNSGRRLYDEALSLSQNESTRERVRAKRDLEVARALLRLRQSSAEAQALLQKAAIMGGAAYPYNRHAEFELKRLPSKPEPA
jgi:tetratricopeptide (TPR) repeat protein